jgi:hypothetical protein
VVVDARAKERRVAVRVGDGPVLEILDDLVFGDARRQRQRAREADRLRQVSEQFFGGIHAASLQHLAALGFRLRKVTQLALGSYVLGVIGGGH